MSATASSDVFKCRNQLLVEKFMARMHYHPIGAEKQQLPVRPTIPSLDIRKLRAALLLEEALETIAAMGLSVSLDMVALESGDHTLEMEHVHFVESGIPNLKEVLDGCADVQVVTYGLCAAHGIALQPGFEEIAGNNLLKFAPGHSFNERGKLCKPSNHPLPDTRGILLTQGASPSDLGFGEA